jgi:predicted outer membrane repeat protein
LSLTDATFLQNSAGVGGAVYAAPGTGPVTVNGSYFGNVVPPVPGGYFNPFQLPDGNTATESGGAIYDIGVSSLTINSTFFLANRTPGGAGGAISYGGSGTLTVGGNSVFDGNTATDEWTGAWSASGGAIYTFSWSGSASAPTTIIYSTSFDDNLVEDPRVTVAKGLPLPGADAAGGAIEDQSGSLTITNSSFTGNEAIGGNGLYTFGGLTGGAGGTGTGGAIDFESASTLDISQGVTFTGNEAQGGSGGKGGPSGNGGVGGDADGGALAVNASSGNDYIVATFTGNSAVGGPGGPGGLTGGEGGNGNGVLYILQTTATIQLSGTTFSASTATGGKGGSPGGAQGSRNGPDLVNNGATVNGIWVSSTKLTTYHLYPVDLTALGNDIAEANTLANSGSGNLPTGTTAVEIDLDPATFTDKGTYAYEDFTPLVNGLNLSIVNKTGTNVNIPLSGSRFLTIGASAGTVTINGGAGIALTGGSAGSGNGGAIDDEGTNPSSSLSVSNVTFTGDSAASGGAIYAGPGSGPVDVESSFFGTSNIKGNTATTDGGGIDYEGAFSLTINNSSFVDNTAADGGAVEVGSQCDAASLTNCQFGTSFVVVIVGSPPQGNTATTDGGAINYEGQLHYKSSLSLTDVTFLQSTASEGGAVYTGPGTGPVTVNGSYFGNVVPFPPPYPFFDGNTATTDGGAIYDTGASALAINSSFFLVNNAEGGEGGAIDYGSSGNLTIGGNSVFDDNQTTDTIPGTASLGAFGGAICTFSPAGSASPPTTIIYSTSFDGNWAQGPSGSLAAGANAQGADAAGGAIEVMSGSGPLTITNSSFTDNEAEGGNGANASGSGNGGAGGAGTGGAIDFESASTVYIWQGVTFTGNKATGGQGGQGAGSGSGGTGGDASGGGFAVNADSGSYGGPVDEVAATFMGNSAVAGPGGKGGSSGMGADGGVGVGGAMRILDPGNLAGSGAAPKFTIEYSTFSSNTATAGAAGSGTSNGTPGVDEGGGFEVNGAIVTGNWLTFSDNTATVVVNDPKASHGAAIYINVLSWVYLKDCTGTGDVSSNGLTGKNGGPNDPGIWAWNYGLTYITIVTQSAWSPVIN